MAGFQLMVQRARGVIDDDDEGGTRGEPIDPPEDGRVALKRRKGPHIDDGVQDGSLGHGSSHLAAGRQFPTGRGRNRGREDSTLGQSGACQFVKAQTNVRTRSKGVVHDLSQRAGQKRGLG
ncbi:hypothetical protein Sa4125_29450 [Aureimonas sp. SA4125]|nr:hypothetical protein Sa4125_29450 [Aureimonas sp. SA4125]